MKMKKKKKKRGPRRYLPVRVFGNDMIIDYESRELVFPNREKSAKIDLDYPTRLSCYLKMEGFLDDMEAGMNAESGACACGTNVNVLPATATSSLETAEVSYVKPIGNSRTLVGLYWESSSELGRRVEDFALERLGKVEAYGMEPEYGRSGWAIVARFRSCVGDTIKLRFETTFVGSEKFNNEMSN
jgi:hypothetical protein